MELTQEKGRAASRYAKLEDKRSYYLRQAELSAGLTIPSLFPPFSDSRDRSYPQDLPDPWQNFGAYAVESLSSKYLVTSFPPQAAFFRYEITEASIQEAKDSGLDDASIADLRMEIQKALASRERAIVKEFDTGTYRVGLAEVFRQLIVSGNCLVNVPRGGGGLRVFHLNRFVVKRGPMGKLLELVIKEDAEWVALPDNIKELSDNPADPDSHRDERVSIFTHVEYHNGFYHSSQEAFGKTIPGSESKYPEDKSPWLALRFTTIEGEDYGRGFVEQYRGALNSLEVLRRAITENSAAAARTIFMVRPNGGTKVRNLQNTPNGGYVSGDATDVSVLRMDKQGDMMIAKDTAQELIKELSFAFLLNSAVRRDAERVTAEEIRELARELESTQGGVWSVLSQELQLPIVKRIEAILEARGDIKSLPKNTVEPVIVTGLQAIGRTQDLVRIREMLTDLAAVAQLKPEVMQFIDARDLVTKIFLGHGIPEDGLLKTKEEVEEEMQRMQQEAQQRAMQESVMQAVPGSLEKAAGSIVDQGMGNGSVPQ